MHKKLPLQLIGTVLCAALIVTAPGLPCYQALGAVAGRSRTGAGRRHDSLSAGPYRAFAVRTKTGGTIHLRGPRSVASNPRWFPAAAVQKGAPPTALKAAQIRTRELTPYLKAVAEPNLSTDGAYSAGQGIEEVMLGEKRLISDPPASVESGVVAGPLGARAPPAAPESKSHFGKWAGSLSLAGMLSVAAPAAVSAGAAGGLSLSAPIASALSEVVSGLSLALPSLAVTLPAGALYGYLSYKIIQRAARTIAQGKPDPVVGYDTTPLVVGGLALLFFGLGIGSVPGFAEAWPSFSGLIHQTMGVRLFDLPFSVPSAWNPVIFGAHFPLFSLIGSLAALKGSRSGLKRLQGDFEREQKNREAQSESAAMKKPEVRPEASTPSLAASSGEKRESWTAAFQNHFKSLWRVSPVPVESALSRAPEPPGPPLDMVGLVGNAVAKILSVGVFTVTGIAFYVVAMDKAGGPGLALLMSLGSLLSISLTNWTGKLFDENAPVYGMSLSTLVRLAANAAFAFFYDRNFLEWPFMVLLGLSLVNGWILNSIMNGERIVLRDMIGSSSAKIQDPAVQKAHRKIIHERQKTTNAIFALFFVGIQVLFGIFLKGGGWVDAYGASAIYKLGAVAQIPIVLIYLATLPDRAELDQAALTGRAATFTERLKKTGAKSRELLKLLVSMAVSMLFTTPKRWIQRSARTIKEIFSRAFNKGTPADASSASGKPSSVWRYILIAGVTLTAAAVAIWLQSPLVASLAFLVIVPLSPGFKFLWNNAFMRTAMVYTTMGAVVIFPLRNVVLPILAKAAESFPGMAAASHGTGQGLVLGLLIGALFMGQLLGNIAMVNLPDSWKPFSGIYKSQTLAENAKPFHHFARQAVLSALVTGLLALTMPQLGWWSLGAIPAVIYLTAPMLPGTSILRSAMLAGVWAWIYFFLFPQGAAVAPLWKALAATLGSGLTAGIFAAAPYVSEKVWVQGNTASLLSVVALGALYLKFQYVPLLFVALAVIGLFNNPAGHILTSYFREESYSKKYYEFRARIDAVQSAFFAIALSFGYGFLRYLAGVSGTPAAFQSVAMPVIGAGLVAMAVLYWGAPKVYPLKSAAAKSVSEKFPNWLRKIFNGRDGETLAGLKEIAGGWTSLFRPKGPRNG
ncbi:MAG: hypothetical protein HY611_09340 [Elusimicrobia bacterium]|nr:hypothetical protein [Elusimicrobiota bacterium]